MSQSRFDASGGTKQELNVYKAETTTQMTDLFTQKGNNDIYLQSGRVSSKAIYNVGGHIFVVTRKPHGKGYIRFRLRSGLTTTTESLGGAQELLRVVEVFNVPDCFSLKLNEVSNNDGAKWATLTNALMSGITVPYRRNSVGSAIGDWIEYSVVVPAGIYSIQALLYLTSGGSDSITISIDGVDEVTGVTCKEATSQFGRIDIPITPGTHTLRFTSVNAGFVSIAGVNVVDLKDYKDGFNFDNIVTLHEGATNEYITNGGSCDYAMFDSDLQKWCGSYHGGETQDRVLHLIDGVSVPMGVGDAYIGNAFELEQDTNINDKINAFSRNIFKQDGSREFEVSFVGNINLTTLYVNMTTTKDTYDTVLYPKRINTDANGTYYLPRNCNYVVQRNDVNNQKVITVLNNNILPITDLDNAVKVQTTQGFYNKVYKANIESLVPVNFTEGNFRVTHIFE